MRVTFSIRVVEDDGSENDVQLIVENPDEEALLECFRACVAAKAIASEPTIN